MSNKSLTLQGKHIRLEPLGSNHAEGLAAASATDPSLYRWSPIPQGVSEAKKYIDTALAWQQAGTAVPFAIVRMHDSAVIGSTRFWNIEVGVAPRTSRSRARFPGRLRDRLYVVRKVRSSYGREYRSQAPHAKACLRSLAGPSRLLPHRRAQSAFPCCA